MSLCLYREEFFCESIEFRYFKFVLICTRHLSTKRLVKHVLHTLYGWKFTATWASHPCVIVEISTLNHAQLKYYYNSLHFSRKPFNKIMRIGCRNVLPFRQYALRHWCWVIRAWLAVSITSKGVWWVEVRALSRAIEFFYNKLWKLASCTGEC